MKIPGQASGAIRFERVSKDYVVNWSGSRWRALKDVSFAIPAGSLCALVGANGSGKSTILKICAGLTTASSGACRVGGAADTPFRARIGYLAENPSLPGFLSGAQLLERLALIGGASRRLAREQAEKALAQTQLSQVGDRRVAEYSRGLRQRLGLAQALLGEPEILLLDEPASGLDPRAIETLTGILRAQRERGRTVLMSSHFLPQVEEVCDHFILLDRGRVLFEGSREQVEQGGGIGRLYLEKIPA